MFSKFSIQVISYLGFLCCVLVFDQMCQIWVLKPRKAEYWLKQCIRYQFGPNESGPGVDRGMLANKKYFVLLLFCCFAVLLFCCEGTKYFVVLLCNNKIFCSFAVLLLCCFAVLLWRNKIFCCFVVQQQKFWCFVEFCWFCYILFRFVV